MRLSEAAKNVAMQMRSHGINITLPESKGECMESLGEMRGHAFALYFFPGKFSNGLIIKIERTVKSCYEALVSPSGIFYIVTGGRIDNSTLTRKIMLTVLAQRSEE